MSYNEAALEPSERILLAAENGQVGIVRELLHNNKSLVNSVDEDLYTPLHRACYNDHADVVSVLLEHGANALARTSDGWQPLHSAARWGSADAAKTLLTCSKVDVNALTNGKITALHLAASSREPGALKITQILLLHPDIDRTIRNGAGENASEIARRTSKEMQQLFNVCD